MKSDYLAKRVLDGIYTESAGEYTLPDYNGDVKRVLGVFPTLGSVESFRDDGGVTFSGSVNYSIVYLDFENKLSHSDFSTDYEYKVKCDMDAYVDSSSQVALTNYNVRLVGPRRFSSKCAISASVEIEERREYLIEGDIFDTGEPEMLEEPTQVGRIMIDRTSEREYAEVIEHLDGVIADECEILITSASVGSETVTVGQQGGIHKGVINVSCLVQCSDEVPHRAGVDVPFEHKFFEAEAPEGIKDARGTVNIKSLRVNVVPDNEGVNIVASVIADGEMTALTCSSLNLVRDVYSTERGCDNNYGSFSYTEYVGTFEDRRDVIERIPSEEAGCEGARNILYTNAYARVLSTELCENSVKIKGDIRLSGIACQINEDGKPTYVGVKTDVPFEENVNVNCHLDTNDRVIARASVTDAVMDLDSTHVNVRCSLLIGAEINRDRCERTLVSSTLTDEMYEDERGRVTVYYPEEGETLFEIAKRYHKSLVSVASVNRLTESVFNDTSSPIRSLGVDRLIIR